ncbi:tandem-95 repeat protein, partial [Inhella gelatinilytica]
ALRDQSKVAVGVGSTAAQNVSFYLNDAFKTLSNADWAELIVTNLHMTGDAKLQAKAFLIGALAGDPNLKRGDLLIIAVSYLPTLVDDAVFGSSAQYFNNSVALSYSFSMDPANVGVTSLAALKLADEPNTAPVAVADSASATEGGAVIGGTVAANDTDKEGDALSFSLVAGQDPVPGLVFNANGTFTFDPTDAAYNSLAAGATRAITVNYKVSDGMMSSNGVLTITVTGTNDVPTAAAVVASGLEDGGAIAVTPVASDVDGDTLSYTVAVQPLHGSVSFNATTGKFEYTPAANWNGVDTFTYKVSDGKGGEALAVATVSVGAVNDAPTANAASASVLEDGSVGGTVTGADIDGNALTYAVATGPANGTVVFNADGSYVYTPNANFNGTDSFTFTATDGLAVSAATTVSITVGALNDAPVAGAVSASGAEDGGAIAVTPIASDIDGDTLSYSVVTGAANGSVSFNSTTGKFDYTPNANFYGTDTFVYMVADGNGGTSMATATVTVTSVNDAPTANTPAAVSVAEDASVGGTVTGADIDGDALTYAVATAPANGTVVFNANGTYVYTPAANFNGTDSFTFTVNDGLAVSAPKTVSITVSAVNDAPVAGAVTAVGAEDAAVIAVTPVATDIDGDTLSYSVLTGAAHGTVVWNATTGKFDYTPAANWNGTDTFTYQVSDGNGGTSTATATVTVTAVNDAPVATAAAVTTDEELAVNGQLVASDIDNATLAYAKATNPANGSVVINASTGTFVYTPNANFNGTDSFTYTVTDAGGLTSTATVTITVNPVDEVLTAGLDNITLTSADERIRGFNNNLNAGDNVNGGTGNDILSLNIDSAVGSRAFASFTLTGVETFEVTNDSISGALTPVTAATSFDLSQTTGITTLRSVNSTANVFFNYATIGSNLEVRNLTDGTSVGLDFRNDDVIGTSDVANVLVTDSDDDGIDAETITIGGVNGADTTSGIETVNLTARAESSSDSVSNVRINDFNTPGTTTLNINASNALTIGDTNSSLAAFENALSGSVNRVDATASTAAVALSTEDNDTGATVLGGAGGDTFVTGDGADTVEGNGGNDWIRAGLGNNSVLGGAGADTIVALGGNDTIRGGEGDDNISAGDGANVVDGNEGADTITVGSGNDVVSGGSENDTIDITAGGADSVDAGTGNDTVNAGTSLSSSFTETSATAGGDTLVGGDGTDTLNLSANNADGNILDRVTGFENIVIADGTKALVITVTDTSPFDSDSGTATTIDASAMNDAFTFEGNDLSPTNGVGDEPIGSTSDDVLSRAITILGGSANDSIVTGLGADSIRGNGGNDTIKSGAGNDTIDGANGTDNIAMEAGDDLLIVQSGELDGADAQIAGGSGTDTINLVNPTKVAPGTAVTITAALGDEVSGIQTLKVVDNENTYNNNTVAITVAGAAGNYNNLENGGDTRSVLAIDGGDLDAGEVLTVNTAALDVDGDGIDEDFNITGGAGADHFWMGNNLDSGDTVAGGAGDDTLHATGNGAGDGRFANVTSVQTYDYASAHSATLGANAQNAGIVSVTGSSGDDTLSAAAYTVGLTVNMGTGEDNVTTGSGNDTIDGQAGHDTISSGAGNDTVLLNGASYNENINLGSGDDNLIVTGTTAFGTTDVVAGGSGTDTVTLSDAAGNVTANVNLTNVTDVERYVTQHTVDTPTDIGRNFTVNFSGGNVSTLNTVTVDASSLTTGIDTLTVDLSALADKDYQFNITGGAGNDTVVGSAPNLPENLVFNAGAGNDRLEIDGTDLGTTVTTDGGDGRDTLAINNGSVTDDSFVGVTNYEILTATAGLGLVQAQLGAQAKATGIDSIIGGSGNDNVLLDAAFVPASGGLAVDLSAGGNDTINGGASATAINFQSTASTITAADVLTGGTTANDSFSLAADNGTADLSNVTGVETFNVVENGDANIGLTITNNTFTGVASGTITVNASALNDTTTGAGLEDLPEGGMTLNAGGVTGSRHFNVTGGTGSDNITTGAGNDTINLGLGNDTVNSGAGDDVITNDDGNKLVTAGSGNDTVTLGNGNSTVDAGTGTDSVTVGNGNNSIVAGTGNDTVVAGTGNNTIWGGDGDDQISVSGIATQAGSTITGGAGSDQISLGAGADRLRVENVSDSVGLTRDVVTGFTSGNDRIVIETQAVSAAVKATFAGAPVMAADAYNTANQIGVNFAGNANDFSDAQGAISLTANDGKADYVFQKDINKLWIDVNDDGVLNGLDVQITLSGVTSLQSGDIVLRDTIAPVFPAEVGSVAEVRLSAATTDTNLVGNLDAIDTDGGAVTYTAVTGGALAAGIWTKVGTYGTLTLNSATGAFTYTKNTAAIEALDDGESGSDTFTITATDDVGLTATNTYTVSVTGADDQPTIAAVTSGTMVDQALNTAALASTSGLSGTLVGADVDIETLTYGITGGSAQAFPNGHMIEKVGSYGTLVVNSLTGAYTYTPNQAAVEAVADGETPSDVFTVTVSDGDDGVVTTTYTVNVTGANDLPFLVTATDVTGAITEDLNIQPITFKLIEAGSFTFDDTDLSDTHTVSVTAAGGNRYAGVLTPTITTAATGAGNGTVQWNYSVDSLAVQELTEGEYVDEVYTITVTDINGATFTQNVTIRITGTNDIPTIVVGSTDAAGAVTEDASNPNLTDTGTITFADLDSYLTADVHTAAITTDQSLMLGTLSLGAVNQGADTVAWTFTVANSAVQYLAVGQTVTQNYTVRITDEEGAFVDQAVQVVITGVNDAPVISVETGDVAAVGVTETNAGLTASDTLTVVDVDTTDTVTNAVTAVAVGGTYAGGSTPVNATLLAMMGVNAGPIAANTGDVNNITWSFNSGAEAFNFLAVGET